MVPDECIWSVVTIAAAKSQGIIMMITQLKSCQLSIASSKEGKFQFIPAYQPSAIRTKHTKA